MAHASTSAASQSRHELTRRLDDADLVLRYLSERGVTNPRSSEAGDGAPPEWTVRAVNAARSGAAAGELAPETESAFARALANLSYQARPATLEGIRAKYHRLAAWPFYLFGLASVALFVVLVFFYAGVLSLSNSLKDIDAQNAAIARLAQEGEVARAQGDCDRLVGVNYNTNLAKKKARVSYETVHRIGAWLTLGYLAGSRTIAVELYPLGFARAEENGRATCREIASPASAAPAAADGACQAGKDCGLDETEAVGRLLLHIFGAIVLPMLFGAAGSAVYALRRGVVEREECTYTTDAALRYWIRFGLGSFFGPFIGLMLGPDASASVTSVLSPFAISFLAGYGVEGVFSLLDRATHSLKRAGRPEPDDHAERTPPRPAAAAG